MPVSPFVRQITIVASSVLAAMSVGGAVTYPSLIMEQFQINGDNSTELRKPLDIDTKSWIGSMYGLAGIVSILIPMIAQKMGRKWGYITTCTCSMVGWIIAYQATTVAEIFICEYFLGLGTNSFVLICFMSITEMLGPKYRHVTMQAIGLAEAIGMAACGILGCYLHFKTVSLIMLVPIVIAIALALTWIESPSWLAYRGEFDKFQNAFLKLRGDDEDSAKEMQDIITAQRENLSATNKTISIRNLWKKITRRDFYLPSLHTFVLFQMTFWGGVDMIYVYFNEIITKTAIHVNTTFYASIVMYWFVVTGITISNLLIYKFKCKSLLRYSSCALIICLLVCSCISALQTLGMLSTDSLLLTYSLVAFITVSKTGFHGTVYIISADLMPVKHRNVGGVIYILTNSILYASSLKLSPYISLYVGMWCTFFIYALNVSVCLWIVLKFVPETKGKSLQEIEDYYTFGEYIKRHNEDDLVKLRVGTIMSK